jgi:hypothetical protein
VTREETTGSLVAVLAPFLGENMARAAVQAQLQKVASGTGPLAAPEREALVEKLGRGLVVFLGRAKTTAVVEEMRAAVGLSGAKPGNPS